jgi:multidrug resistance efflux pump
VEQQQAESQLKRRQLIAPATGVIQDLYGLERGEAVPANSPAARLVDTSHCVFTAYVQGSVAHGFEKGKPVEISLKSGEEEINVTGSIEFVALTVDAASGLQVVRAGFDNKDARVLAGLPGKIRLQPAKKS